MGKSSFFKDGGGDTNTTVTIQSQVDGAAASATSAAASATQSASSATDSASAQAASEAARDAAVAAKTSSEAARDAAISNKNSSDTNATNAASSASAASTSASNASSSASSAATSASNASTSETNAATSATTASTAATSAQTAQTAAETAKTAAETAKTAAETAKTSAETAETNSTTAATSASNSAATAASEASTATTKASEAATSATNAATSATNASTSATASSNSASSAASAQTAAEAARDSALTALDNFDDRYLGSKTSDPTLDNDGNALVGGSLFFDETNGIMKVYTGSAWVAAYASTAGTLLVANNLSDVESAATSRTNLGLATVAATGAYSDLSGTPTIPAPAITDVSGTPTLVTGITAAEVRTAIGAGTSSFDGAFGSLSGKPTTISGYGITDSFSGAYNDLTGKPTLFDGAFSSLTGKPTTIAGYGITDALQLGTTSTTALAGNTSIPTTLTDLGISDGSANQVLSTNGSGTFTFVDQTGGGGSGDSIADADNDTKVEVEASTDNDTIIFTTAGSEVGRFTSSDLLIGKTANDTNAAGIEFYGVGAIGASYAGRPLYVNRLSTEGNVIDVAKDGTLIGSLGVIATNNLYLSNAADGIGLGIGDDNLYPVNGSGNANGSAVDIGDSTVRFRNLYLSGDIDTNSNIYTDNAILWNVSASDNAHQRADARDDGTNFSRLHWYGVRDSGSTSNFRHAWYDGSSYINVTAASGQVGFGGNVNVGTSGTLDSGGQLNIYRSANPYIGWYSGTTTRGAYLQYVGSGDHFHFGDASYVNFDCNIRHEGQYNYNDTAQYIWWTGQSYGNFRTGGGNVNGYSGIEFSDSSSDTTLMIRNSDGLNGFYRADAGSWFWYSDSANHFRSYGNVTAYASDERLKTFHGKVESSLEKICQIDGLYYEWDKEACSKTDFTPVFNKMEIGLKAQQVEALFPEVVELAPFDTDPMDKGVDQSKSGENYLTLHYERLVPVLIEAIKELKAEIDVLKGVEND